MLFSNKLIVLYFLLYNGGNKKINMFSIVLFIVSLIYGLLYWWNIFFIEFIVCVKYKEINLYVMFNRIVEGMCFIRNGLFIWNLNMVLGLVRI